MKDSMEYLAAINLKEVSIIAMGDGDDRAADEIPHDAFNSKKTLTNLVLPDKLKAIRTAAFSGCSNLTGSLLIPEGVTEIDKDAFYGCRSFNGTLSLPTTLKSNN